MKYLHMITDGITVESHPARGAWIEIHVRLLQKLSKRVAPRKGCVD